ncbi:MAG: LamG domain-containing protein [Bacteroidota bacterium]
MNIKTLPLSLLLFVSMQIHAQTLPPYVPADGLIGWWPFSGNAVDSSGTGNNGTASNTTLTSDRFGNTNAAYSFNGFNSRIEIPEAASLNCTKLSLSAWVFNRNISKTGQIIYKGSSFASGETFSLTSVNSYPGYALKIASACQPAIGWKGGRFKQLASQGTWEHLVLTYDGTVSRLYKNGAPDTSATLSGLIDICQGGGLRFGYNHNLYSNSTGDCFDGVIDDIGIWNRALTQTEVGRLFSANMDCSDVGNLGVNVCVPQRSLHVKDVIRLEPRSFSPPNPSKGDIYFDGVTNKLRVYDGTTWRDCW